MCKKLQSLLRQHSFFNVSGGCGYDMSYGNNPCMSNSGLWFHFCPFCGKEIVSKYKKSKNGGHWTWWEKKRFTFGKRETKCI